MSDPKYRVRRNTDNSIDVWVDEHHVHFPLDGTPEIGEEKPPEDAPEDDEAVNFSRSGETVAIGCRGEEAVVGPGGVRIVGAPPAQDVVSRRRWRAAKRMPLD